MDIPLSERRQIENELVFRRANEDVANSLAEIDARHKEEGNSHLVVSGDIVLHFRCECSDENCQTRIPMELNVYQNIHANRKAFVLKPGHQVKKIEKVVKARKDYNIVQKKHLVPEPSGGLNKTTVNNT